MAMVQASRPLKQIDETRYYIIEKPDVYGEKHFWKHIFII